MNETPLMRLSLIASFFGLFLLFITTLFIEAEEVSIADVEGVQEKDVKITGKVVAIKDFGSLAVVEVAEIKSVDVVVFDKRMLRFTIDDDVIVTGEVKDYKGEREIVAERIRIIK